MWLKIGRVCSFVGDPPSTAWGSTRLEMEEAALEREAARKSFGWDSAPSPSPSSTREGKHARGSKEFREPLATGAGGPRGRVGNAGRDTRAPPVGREREIAETLYNSDAMYNPGPTDFECNAHKTFGAKIDGRPWFYSKFSPAGLEALHAARNSGRWNGGGGSGGAERGRGSSSVIARGGTRSVGFSREDAAASPGKSGGGVSSSSSGNGRQENASLERGSSPARSDDGGGGLEDEKHDKNVSTSTPTTTTRPSPASRSPSGGAGSDNAGVSPSRLEIGRGGLREVPRVSSSGLSLTSTSNSGGGVDGERKHAYEGGGGGGGARSRPSSAPLRRGAGKGGGANRPVGVAARPDDREARAKDPRQDGTFGGGLYGLLQGAVGLLYFSFAFPGRGSRLSKFDFTPLSDPYIFFLPLLHDARGFHSAAQHAHYTQANHPLYPNGTKQ